MIFGNDNLNEINIKYLWLRSFWRSLNIFNLSLVVLERIFFLLVLAIFPFLFKGKNNKILALTWIFFPLLILSQYKGAISEYYYGMVTALIPFFLSYILFEKIKNKLILTLIIFILFLFPIRYITSRTTSPTTLNDKKAVVSYLVNQKQDQPFNLSYETDIGFDFGFDYLFNYYGNYPQNIPQAHLYTLFTDKTLPPNLKVVFNQSIYSLARR